jgi:signal transduction histidine kinase
MDMVREAQEAERRRAARDIHDRLGYWLGLAHIELELFDLYQGRDLGRAGAHLISSRQAVAEGLAEIRRMVTGLRAPVESLEKALLVVTEGSGVKVSVVVEGEDGLPDHLRGELYLVLREALRNVFAHAGAERVSVRVEVGASRVEAAVVDDGAGFTGIVEGGGIPSMRERIGLLGGGFRMCGKRGCRLEMWVPLHPILVESA